MIVNLRHQLAKRIKNILSLGVLLVLVACLACVTWKLITAFIYKLMKNITLN